MPVHLDLDDYATALTNSGAALCDAARGTDLRAPVPTCPGWTVADLVAHQGMVHRWATAQLRGDTGHDVDATHATGMAAPDPLAWLTDGITALLETLHATPGDAPGWVFLKDAPAPRLFWARRQAHETTVHGVDALAAGLGRWPDPSETVVPPHLAADGVDELLCGFVPRSKTPLRSAEPYTAVVRSEDTGHVWSVRVSETPVVTTVGAADEPDLTIRGTAARLYLTLWNRAGGGAGGETGAGNDIVTVDGRVDLFDEWRSQLRVNWG